MRCCLFEHDSYTDCYLTGLSTPGRTAADVFAWAAGELAARRAQVVSEKLYGRLAAREPLLAARAAALAAAGLPAAGPAVLLEDAPLDDGDFAGLQIWAVIPRHADAPLVRPFAAPNGVRGRVFESGGLRQILATAVTGPEADGALSADPTRQAAQMFARAEAALASQGASYAQVARTWIYLSRLLDWYDDFNRVRTPFYRRVGFGPGPAQPPLPASTGIQGRVGGEECVMDALALVDGAGRAACAPIRSTARQGSAADYGSSFSRGMAVRHEGRRTIHVSGTASIAPSGESLHLGDAAAQVVETLECVRAVLAEQGADWADVASVTCFCKNTRAYEALRAALGRLGDGGPPAVFVRADVCRPELLVEIEAVAVI